MGRVSQAASDTTSLQHPLSRASRIREEIAVENSARPNVLSDLLMALAVLCQSRRDTAEAGETVPVAEATRVRHSGLSVIHSEGSAISSLSSGAILSRQFAILVAIFVTTSLISSAQSIPIGGATGGHRSVLLRTRHKSRRLSPPPPFTHLKPPTLEAPYQPFTPRDRLRWFSANTIDPANLAGGIFDAAFGTAPNRPKEY